ncbi:receptor-like protein 7 [Bidens hawaiensis]|uniref:receptor-like protein 7 n=1 Tax=Bidens hawaiensis TaxID=980011 RepID=UPI004049EA2F
MRISWMIILVIGLQLHTLPHVVNNNQYLSHQQSLLLAFKDDLVYYDHSIAAGWSTTLDCCDWGGITCDRHGRVIGLDLSSQSISATLNDSSTLFALHFLQSLNLAYNDFGSAGLLFPSGFGNLTHLTYLNLSNTYFEGQVPIEISLITRLVTLDLSSSRPDTLYLQNPDLKMLIQNLTELRHLYLDNVNIVTHDWSGVISSLLPNLQVLSLKSCNLSRSLEDSSLAKLKHLSVIILDGNTFSSGIPESFADLQNITVLSLQGCNLSGLLPYKIFQVPTINTIDLSMNVVLEGPLPDSMGAVELQNLILSGTRVGGKLPDSIGSLKALSRIELRVCEFNGPIPESMQNLTRLQVLDLSFNQLTGSTPSFQSSKNHLVWVGLNQNKLTGGIPSFEWEGLDKLEYLDLANNSLTGSFPDAFLTLKSLEHLDLSYNSFSGPLPGFIFKLAAISSLELSTNKFTGRVNLHMFANLKELSVLDLSYNNLTVSVEANNRFSSLSKLNKLKLASCKMQQIPDLKNLSGLSMLDLSDNQLSGEIPSWIWETGNGFLRQLNLSYNKFSSLQKPYTFPFLLDVLDLHFNNLEGDIPIPPTQVYVLDYSNNKFGSSIPVDFGNALTSTFFFSVSNNKLMGPIPQSICNASSLAVLDLSSNSLNGTLPSFGKLINLESLDLSVNKLSGSIPLQLASLSFLSFLNLSYNELSGRIPRGSQFQTFTRLSFKGNQGLCGMPLNKSCSNMNNATSELPTETNEDESDLYVSIGLGFVVGFVMIIGPLVFLRRWRIWYNNHVDGLLSRIMKSKDEGP